MTLLIALMMAGSLGSPQAAPSTAQVAPPARAPAAGPRFGWQVRPQITAADYPARARQENVPTGSVRVICTAQALGGQPEDCEVVSESPEGYGFGQAGLDIMHRGRLTAYDLAPGTAPRRVGQTFDFRLADTEATGGQ